MNAAGGRREVYRKSQEERDSDDKRYDQRKGMVVMKKYLRRKEKIESRWREMELSRVK